LSYDSDVETSASGLGVSMVHGFVHQSGGSVELTSTPGRGACVALYLPASDLAIQANVE
jgi:signal transduction histidine kinase